MTWTITWSMGMLGDWMQTTLETERPKNNPCVVCGQPAFYLVNKMFKGSVYTCQEHVLEA